MSVPALDVVGAGLAGLSAAFAARARGVERRQHVPDGGVLAEGPHRADVGSGNYQRVETTRIGNHCYAGEAAGLQDAMFGFGLVYSLTSGNLAGPSLAEGSNYEQAWQARLAGFDAASVFNRWLYERLADWGRRTVLRHAVAGRGLRQTLNRIYAPVRWKAAVASRLPSIPVLRPERARAGCNCTWCRCHRDGRTSPEETV